MYFQINDTTGSNPGIVWEAHKAVIRGIFIKHGLGGKKAREEQIKKMLEEIQGQEVQHKRTPETTVGNELAHLRRQISDLLRFKAKLLARKLREQRTASYIPHIKGSWGKKHSLSSWRLII